MLERTMPAEVAPIPAVMAPTMAEFALGLLGAMLPPGGEDTPEALYLKQARARIGSNHAAALAAADAREAEQPLGRVARALLLPPPLQKPEDQWRDRTKPTNRCSRGLQPYW